MTHSSARGRAAARTPRRFLRRNTRRRFRAAALLLTILSLLGNGPAAAAVSVPDPDLESSRPGASRVFASTRMEPGAYLPQWTWPLKPEPAVVRHFDPPPERWNSGHRGVDLASGPGVAVLSPGPGRVIFTGTVVDRAVVTVDHGAGLLSSFEPVSSTLSVGDTVAEGQQVGTAATGGHCRAQCLHWGVRLRGDYVDPLDYVTDRRPSVLLPLEQAAGFRGASGSHR